jgi:HAD superfamily hydrolase (TIGR01509 family)
VKDVRSTGEAAAASSVSRAPLSVDAIIFDMDGLMIDSESVYWAAGRQIAARYGKTVKDETLGRMMGRSPLESVRLFAEELGLTEPPQALLEMREGLVIETLRRGVPAMPGLYEVLAEFRPRFKLAVATSAPRRFVDLIVDRLRLGGWFDAIQTSDDVVHGKPHPEIYQKAMARVGVTPQRCVVLEDSSNGALAGKRAGAYVIAVPSPYTREQDFSFVDFQAAGLREAADHVRALVAGRPR